jgi:hypothetical protein
VTSGSLVWMKLTGSQRILSIESQVSSVKSVHSTLNVSKSSEIDSPGRKLTVGHLAQYMPLGGAQMQA